MNKVKSLLLSLPILLFIGCQTTPKQVEVSIVVDKNNIVNPCYLGNGVQWDPYQLDYGKGRVRISDSDWEKLYSRLDNMKPQIIRMCINTVTYVKDRKLDVMYDFEQMSKILDYCQSRNIAVVMGDWGGKMVYPEKNEIDTFMLSNAARYADFLINTKKYSCIKYYNMINEPNGDWSTTKGNYNLWSRAINYFAIRMNDYGLSNKVGIIGPDAAIWDRSESWWVDSCANKLNGNIRLYDIHTYPNKSTVNSGDYSNIIRAYKEKVPAGSQIIIGEIGLKCFGKDSAMEKENQKRISKKPFASNQDSQMFVFDHFYGIDLADALFQSINEGFSGALVWMLDDAMHSKAEEGLGKLKIWGFWNILGEEYFGGHKEEVVRTPYYSWSLLTKYIPRGSKIYKISTSGDNGVRAIAIDYKGKTTIGIVNVSGKSKRIAIKSDTMPIIQNARQYDYIKGKILKDGDCMQRPNRIGLNINLKDNFIIKLPKNGMIIYTNIQ
jgi:hypothetical protein